LYYQHYAHTQLLDEDGSVVDVNTYLLDDGRMVQQAANGFARWRATPTEEKPTPQYGEWLDQVVGIKK
jgi:hypothetical protein